MIQQVRSLSMVLAFVVGAYFHREIAPFVWWLPIGIAVMLSITFIGLDVKKLKPHRMHLWLILAIQLTGIGFWLPVRLAGYPVLAESLYYCAAAPIASAIPIIISLLRGNVEFCTTAMIISQVFFAVVTPFVLPFVVSDCDMSYGELSWVVAQQIFTVLGVPAIISTILRWVYPPCRGWAPKLKDLSLGIWVVNLLVVSSSGVQRIVERGYSLHEVWTMMVGAAVICAFGFIAGYRLGYPDLKRECSQGLGQKNTVLTLYIASQHYASPLAYIGPVCYVFCHNFANAVQLALASRENQVTDDRIVSGQHSEKSGSTGA